VKENIDQRLHYVDDIHHKNKILDHPLKDPTMEQAIVFTATKRQADKLAETLLKMDYSVASLHGDMNQRQRTKTIMQLRNGKLRILIATDVAARGIDVKTISHVINFDLPKTTEDYIHRIGRTGRFGTTGIAFSFATNGERGLILSIEKFTGKTMTCDVIPGLEPKSRVAKRSSSPQPGHPRNKQQRFFPGKKRRSNSARTYA
jgi:superfamily II DNA/RNA helicase